METREQYFGRINRFGRISFVIFFVIIFTIPTVVCAVYDIFPGLATVLKATMGLFLILTPIAISEIVSFVPLLGSGASYLTFETGNVSAPANMPAGSYALLSVRDTGVGMSREVLEHVFEPFYTTRDTGTGLGLSTVYGIIKQHGGDVRAQSTPGAGTTFDIYLPRIAEDQPAAAPAAHSALQPPTGHETILLAEDEPSVRGATTRMLARLGYRVLAAGNGSEALRLAAEHGTAIDLLLTDLVMPQMSGSDLAARLHELLPTCRVLFLSGYTDDAVVKDIAVDRNLPFLEKPYTNWTLARKVRQVLDAPLKA